MTDINMLVEGKMKTVGKIAKGAALGAGTAAAGMHLGTQAAGKYGASQVKKLAAKASKANETFKDNFKTGSLKDKLTGSLDATKAHADSIKSAMAEHRPNIEKAGKVVGDIFQHSNKAMAAGAGIGGTIAAGMAAKKYIQSRKKKK